MLFVTMRFDVMPFDTMPLDTMPLDTMPLDTMPFNEMSLDVMSFDKLYKHPKKAARTKKWNIRSVEIIFLVSISSEPIFFTI